MKDDAVERPLIWIGLVQMRFVFVDIVDGEHFEEACVHQYALVEYDVVGLLDNEHLIVKILALQKRVHVQQPELQVVQSILK